MKFHETAEQQQIQETLKAFGPFVSLTLVDRSSSEGKKTYRYRIEFERNTILQRFLFDERNKLAESKTEEIL